MHLHKILFAANLLLPFIAAAQDTTLIRKGDDTFIQQQLENITENSGDEDADYTSLLDALDHFREHPVNLNTATREQLQELTILNDLQINSLLAHIRKNGKLITIYELQSIDGFDLQTIQRILPFVMVTNNFETPQVRVADILKKGQSTLQFRYSRILEEQKGFTAIDSADLYDSPNSRYIGSPDKLYMRYRFTFANNLSFGFAAEKDQGELFFKEKQKFNYDWYDQQLKGKQGTGFDFYSAHLFLRDIRFVKSLAIGDYQATFGQGLTMWSGYSFGKSVDIMSPKKTAGGLKPYTSVDENKFLRGAGTTVRFGHVEATAFFSRKAVDANVSDTLPDGEIAAISSLQETGYHTTLSEIQDKEAIKRTIYGGNVAYKSTRFSAGITAVNYLLNKKLKRDLSYYNRYEFNDSINTNVGVDYNFVVRNFNFFGEEAISRNGGKAFLNGVLISLDPRLSFSAVHRYYSRDFQNLLSNGFAESSTAINEKGFYIGMVAKPFSRFTLTAYFDRFEFPWLKYQVDAPSAGYDYMAQLNYTPSKKFDAYFRIRSRTKFKNISGEDDIDFIIPYEQTNYRLNTSITILPSVRLKNRIEFVDYKNGDDKTEKGFFVSQDVLFNKMGNPFSFALRYAMFQTDSYDARIYTYENDMPGAYSIPAFSDRGSRFYILLDYSINRHIEVWLRFAQTVYDNKKIISEGSLSEIDGNTKSEIKAQVRFKF